MVHKHLLAPLLNQQHELCSHCDRSSMVHLCYFHRYHPLQRQQHAETVKSGILFLQIEHTWTLEAWPTEVDPGMGREGNCESFADHDVAMAMQQTRNTPQAEAWKPNEEQRLQVAAGARPILGRQKTLAAWGSLGPCTLTCPCVSRAPCTSGDKPFIMISTDSDGAV